MPQPPVIPESCEPRHLPLVDAVIVDVDGTLCDVSGIRHYVAPGQRKRDFTKFHAASAVCPARTEVLDWVRAHQAAGHAVIVVTARKRRWEYLTRRWLRKWDVQFDVLAMRADADERPDVLVKADLLAKLRQRGYRIVAAIADNPHVIALWERERIEVTLVPGWDLIGP